MGRGGPLCSATHVRCCAASAPANAACIITKTSRWSLARRADAARQRGLPTSSFKECEAPRYFLRRAIKPVYSATSNSIQRIELLEVGKQSQFKSAAKFRAFVIKKSKNIASLNHKKNQKVTLRIFKRFSLVERTHITARG